MLVSWEESLLTVYRTQMDLAGVQMEKPCKHEIRSAI